MPVANVCSWLGRPPAAQPLQTVDGVGGRLVLARDVPVVAAGGDRVQVAVKVQFATAGFAAPRVVGDLDVGDPAGVGSQRGVDVVAVVREMEQVAAETEVGDPEPIQHGDHILGGAQRVRLGSTDRLQQNRRIVLRGGLGGQGQVLVRQLVLLL